ncbi:glutamyl-tRNA amidotransferase [bacterium]|nr:glutamyl-tRNA amidotransferase [bacterium]|tara:strand:- start:13412 stop:13864 length:453 start_codon:yes stop_codon:yes gene_type:complete
MLHAQLKGDMKAALKAREEVRLTTLRGLLSACTNELVTLKRKPDEVLEDDSVLTVIRRAVKQRKDSIEQFEKGGRSDLADKEKEELTILEAYLPAQASREEIEAAVDKALASIGDDGPSKTGIVVGIVMKELLGNADGALVKEIVSTKLS